MSWKDGPVVHESWWSAWGKPIAFFLIGIVVVVAAILLALVLAGGALAIYPTTGTTGARHTLLAARSAFEGSNGRSAGSREDEPLPTPALPQSLSAELGCSRFCFSRKGEVGI